MKVPANDIAGMLGNLAALIAVALALALAIDHLAVLADRRPGLFCAIAHGVTMLATTAAIVMATVGAVVFAFSKFQRFELLLGGLVLGALPGFTAGLLGGAACPI